MISASNDVLYYFLDVFIRHSHVHFSGRALIDGDNCSDNKLITALLHVNIITCQTFYIVALKKPVSHPLSILSIFPWPLSASSALCVLLLPLADLWCKSQIIAVRSSLKSSTIINNINNSSSWPFQRIVSALMIVSGHKRTGTRSASLHNFVFQLSTHFALNFSLGD